MAIQDRKNTVFTAPMAIVEVGGIEVGKIKGISCNEEFSRVPIVPLGRLGPEEIPIVGWRGSMSCEMFLCDLGRILYAQNKINQIYLDAYNPLRRDVVDYKTMETTLIISDEIQIDVVIYRKVGNDYDPQTGLPNTAVRGLYSMDANNGDKIGKNAGKQEFARINGIYLTRDSWSVQGESISMHNCEFQYKEPIHYVPNLVVQ